MISCVMSRLTLAVHLQRVGLDQQLARVL